MESYITKFIFEKRYRIFALNVFIISEKYTISYNSFLWMISFLHAAWWSANNILFNSVLDGDNPSFSGK